MNKKWKIVTWTVLLVFLLVPFSVSAEGKKEAAKPEEVMEITWLAKIAGSDEDTTWCMQYVEEKFNVKILPNGINKGEKEKVSIMLAAGEMPDIGLAGDPLALYLEGITRGISRDMFKKYAPNYTRTLNQDYPLGWLVFKNPDKEDEQLSILGFHGYFTSNLVNPAFRVDWAKKVGFELPNYEEKKIPLDRFGRYFFLDESFTMDWFESLLIAFRDGDPDGNGKLDTIPWGPYKDRGYSWHSIMGAFGIADFSNFDPAYGGGNLMENGELYVWSIAPGYKEFLKLAARWYEMGLVDKEFANLSKAKRNEKTGAGMVAACDIVNVNIGADVAMNRPCNNLATLEEVAKGAEVVVIPGPIGPTGLQGGKMLLPSYISSGCVVVNKKVGDEKLAKILEIIDYMSFSENESWIYHRAGKPGVHFDWEGEPWKSKPMKRDVKDIPEGYPVQGTFPASHPTNFSKDRMVFLQPKHWVNFSRDYLMSEKGQKLAILPYRMDLFNDGNLVELRIKYGEILNTMVDEFYLKAITGQIDIDAEWDGYVSKWRKNGGNEILEGLKKAPLVSELMMKGKIVY